MPRDVSSARPVLRNDIEVVVLGDRFLLCIGNETYELPGPEGQQIARVIGLLSEGYSLQEVARLLGLAEDNVAEYVRDLASLGCFRGDAVAVEEGGPERIAANVGFVGVDATSLAILGMLQAEECKLSFVDWRPWVKREALAVPRTQQFVGQPRAEVGKALSENGRMGTASFSEINPWSDVFGDWLKEKSLIVVSTGYLSPATHELVNSRCGEMRIPWLGIRNGPGYTEIGPSVIPPSTPCYVCLALRALLNRSSSPVMPDTRLAGGPQVPLSPREKAEMAALLAVGEMRNLVKGNEVGPTTHLLRVDWSTNQVSRLPVLKLPNCPGCEWW